MSSLNLEDGEIISEEPNATLQANDKLVLDKTVNTKVDQIHCNGSGGVGAGVIVATVSISMEQTHEFDYNAQSNVETKDGNVTARTTTLSMSRTQTRKILTTAYSSADCPLDIDVTFGDNTMVTLGDQSISKVANEASTGYNGNMKRNKRRIINKKNNEIAPPKKRSPNKNSSLKGNRFSVLTSGSQIDDFIDEDEMICVRGASPQHKQSSLCSSPKMLTNLCSSDSKVNGKLKPIKKAKTKKCSSNRAGNSSRSKKPKNKLNEDKKRTTQKNLCVLNVDGDEVSAISSGEVTTLQPSEKAHKDASNKDVTNNNETLQELRQKLCFLTEQQIDSLLLLNVHSPEQAQQALHQTIWQLNSISINKGTQLEAMIATVLNGHDVDMRKLLPQSVSPIDQNLSNILHVCSKPLVEEEEEEEDEYHPLVIDEAVPLSVNVEKVDEKISNAEEFLNISNVPLKLSAVHIDENKIREATKKISERLQQLNTSNVECTVKKQELLHILDKLNELEEQYKIIKMTKKEKQQDVVKQQQPMENEEHLNTLNNNRAQTNEASKCESLVINAVTDEEKISALNSQDKNKDQSNQSESTELVAEQLKLVVNPFAKSYRKISQNMSLEKTLPEVEENSEKTCTENTALVPDYEKAIVNVDTTKKTDDKDGRKSATNKSLTATPESAKMTLRSQRKIITTKVETKTPNEPNAPQCCLTQPKVVISNIKPRRLRIAKRSLTLDSNTAKEVLENIQLSNDSNIIKTDADSDQAVTPEKRPLVIFFDTPKSSTANASTLNTSTPKLSTTNMSNISTPTAANSSQYINDWEDCIDETRIITHLKASPVKSKAQIIDVKYLKSINDLRFRIEEKKKIKENEAMSRMLSSSTKMSTSELPTHILAVEKNQDALQQIKTMYGEEFSEEPKSIMEKTFVEHNTNRTEDQVAEKISETDNIVAQKSCSDNSVFELKCDDVRLEIEETEEKNGVDALEIVEKTIAIKCEEEQKKILEKTSSIVAKNDTDQKCNVEKSYDDQKSNSPNIAIELNSPLRVEKQPNSYANTFSDEENWDNNDDTCPVDPRIKRDTYKVEQKSFNDKFSTEKGSNTNDYNETSNNISYGYNNANKKSKNYKFNANQRGGNNVSKYGEGERNNTDNYNTGRQANNTNHYNGRQSNNADKYGGGQKNNADNYNTGRQANNADKYGGGQKNNADNYNTAHQANNADNYSGRQTNNNRKYSVEQRCSESRGPYEVKYDSDEDWDKEEGNETSTENKKSNNNNNTFNSNNSSNNFSNSYNSNNSYHSNNYTNNASIGNNNSSNSSSDNQASVIESPKKEYNIEKQQFKNQQSNNQQHSSNNSQMEKLEVNKDEWDIVSPTALSPVCPEIASPTYPSVNNLNDYTPAIEINAHMSFPPMPYSLREIKLPNIEVNKPESLDKLLRSNTVDPRLLKYKDKGYMDISSAPPMLSYFSSQQISQYDPRRRTSVMHTSTAQAFQMDCCSPMQPQNANMLLYGYLQRSAWYQGLMSTMKMQINHSIAELVRALNNFQKERLIDASAIFDVFKIDCAGELLEIMRNIGIFIDSNGFISEDKGFGQYGQHAALHSPAPINATYSFMPQILPAPVKQGLLGYSPSVNQHSSCPVVLPPQMQSASFVSCYVDAPTLTPMTPRRSCGYNVQNMDSTSTSPVPFDEMHEEHASGSDAGYYSNKNKRNFDMSDRPSMRGGGGGFNGRGRRGSGSFNHKQRY